MPINTASFAVTIFISTCIISSTTLFTQVESFITFKLPASATKCFSEEVAKDTLAVGTYKIPPEGGISDASVSLRVTGPTPMSVGASKTYFKKERAQFGKFDFTAEETGSHHVCFSNKGLQETRVGLEINVGVIGTTTSAPSSLSTTTTTTAITTSTTTTTTTTAPTSMPQKTTTAQIKTTTQKPLATTTTSSPISTTTSTPIVKTTTTSSHSTTTKTTKPSPNEHKKKPGSLGAGWIVLITVLSLVLFGGVIYGGVIYYRRNHEGIARHSLSFFQDDDQNSGGREYSLI